jgi:fumarate reductase subunit C
MSGVLLVLFMWGHMFFVSSILISKEAMWTITRMFEGYFLFGQSYPGIVSAVVLAVWLLLVVHVIFALRRIPVSIEQFQIFSQHRRRLTHPDTTAWWVQIMTGFALLFLVSPHLFQMLMHPAEIGPYASADRVWSGHWWPLYLLLLFCVELHAGFGLYRVAVKWGIPGSHDPIRQRQLLHRLKWFLTVFFLGLGLLTLTAYMKIGYAHQSQRGQPYSPSHSQSSPMLHEQAYS